MPNLSLFDTRRGDVLLDAKALAQISPLVSAKITTTTAWIDLDLSDPRYIKYIFMFQNLFFNVTTYPVMAFSYDGGVTFINDLINNDSYAGIADIQTGIPANPGPVVTLENVATLAPVIDMPFNFNDPSSAVKNGGSGTFEIIPGSPNNLAYISGETFSFFGDGSKKKGRGEGGLNEFATVPPTVGRINLARFLPAGNYDVNPPTGTEAITECIYSLYGIFL